MLVKRIITNISTSDVSKARRFYADILGLEVVMDFGWIVTFASPAQMAPQLSVATEGGFGTLVPDISIEVARRCVLDLI
jgi:catechol 2,3-dioxygenase-like lactoylglutathione lyase family enzyme